MLLAPRRLAAGFLVTVVAILGGLAPVRADDPPAVPAPTEEARKLASAAYERGRICFTRGENDKAIAHFDESLRHVADSPPVEVARAFAKGRLRRFDEAIADLDGLLERHPKLPDAWGARAAMRMEKGDLDGAVTDLGKVIELAPSYEAHLDRARIHARFGRHRESVADLDAALVLRPGDLRTRTLRAAMRIELEDYPGAIDDLDAFLETRRHFGPLLMRGKAKARVGDLDGALADLDAALAMNPRLVEGYVERASVWQQRGDLAKARADIDRIVELAPELGYVLRFAIRELQGELEGAIADIDQALERLTERMVGHRPRLLKARGRLLVLVGRRDEAIAAFRDAAAAAGALDSNPAIWLAAIGGGTEALEVFRPGLTGAWPTQMITFALGDIGSDELLAAAEPEGAEARDGAHWLVGLIAERDGDRAKARKHYDACIAVGLESSLRHVWTRHRLARWDAEKGGGAAPK